MPFTFSQEGKLALGPFKSDILLKIYFEISAEVDRFRIWGVWGYLMNLANENVTHSSLRFSKRENAEGIGPSMEVPCMSLQFGQKLNYLKFS